VLSSHEASRPTIVVPLVWSQPVISVTDDAQRAALECHPLVLAERANIRGMIASIARYPGTHRLQAHASRSAIGTQSFESRISFAQMRFTSLSVQRIVAASIGGETMLPVATLATVLPDCHVRSHFCGGHSVPTTATPRTLRVAGRRSPCGENSGCALGSHKAMGNFRPKPTGWARRYVITRRRFLRRTTQ
jgi:hypothetical protein